MINSLLVTALVAMDWGCLIWPNRPLALIKTLTLNPSPDLGEGHDHPPRDRRNPAVLAPLRPPWEKGLGGEGKELIRARGLFVQAIRRVLRKNSRDF